MSNDNEGGGSTPPDSDDPGAGRRERGGERPTITEVEPEAARPGDRLRIGGRNLGTARVYAGPFETEVVERSDDALVVELDDLERPALDALSLGDLPIDVAGRPRQPPGYWREHLDDLLWSRDRLAVSAVGPGGVHVVPDVVDVGDIDFGDDDDDEETWRTFSGPADPSAVVRPSGTGQRYLVLVCLPADRSAPDGDGDEAVSRVEGAVASAGEHWEEASLGEATFEFDVYDDVIDLPEDWSHYYRVPEPARIDAEGATYPVDVDGETLTVESGAFDAEVTFAGDGLALSEVVDQVNDAIDAEVAGAVPVEASGNDDGQLRLETTATGGDEEVSVTGGSAVGTLGLSDDETASGESGRHRMREAAEAAVAERLKREGGSAESFIQQYDGVIVAQAMRPGELRARATVDPWNLNLELPSGETIARELGLVHIASHDDDQTFAHEIGHNMGFPDLYDEPGPPELVGEELTDWDVMANSDALHPSAWIKTWLSGRTRYGETARSFDPWITDVEEVYRPESGESIDPVEVILYPQTIPLPDPGEEPYAEDYPDLPVVQAIRLHTSPEGYDRDRDWRLYLEAREAWEYDVNPFGDRTRHDGAIPGAGVVATDAVDRLTDDRGNTDVPIHRAHATYLAGPLSAPADEWTRTFPGGDELTVRVQETIEGDPRRPEWYDDPTAYKLRIEWGPGEGDGESAANLEIRSWDPPPWDSKDIWLDANWENDWDEYVHSDASETPEVAGHPVRNGDRARAGQSSRLYARVYNHGPDAATNVRVAFTAKVPPGNQPGVPIGTDTISRIEPDEFGLASVGWTPADDNDEHVCVQAGVTDADQELPDPDDAVAQENVTEWYLESASPYQPVSQSITVHNPLPRRAHCVVDVGGLRPGYHVDVKPASLWLDPDESREIEAVLRADDDVPTDADLRRAGRRPPLVSIDYQLSHGCTWIPVNGVSGTIHTVRSTDADATASIDGDTVEVVTETETSGDDDESASGATVTVTLSDDDGAVVASARTTADRSGTARVLLDLDDADREVATRGTVFVSATPATAPAETTFRLDDRKSRRAG